MRKFLMSTFIALGLVSSFALAQQEPNDSDGDVRYISDDLQTFMHSGPGRNYRILGSVVAGTRVIVLQENEERGFLEIIDDTQRTGWVETQYITRQQSIKEVLPNVQAELQQTTETLSSQTRENELLNQQLTDLTTRNERLVKDLQSIEKENQRIQRELDMQDQSAQMEWFTRGGIIALVSIILGVIIAYLPKKRRRNDQWM